MSKVTATKPSFVTTDREEFDNQQDAEAHQAVIDAKQEFVAASDKFIRLLAQSYRTADGELFDFTERYYVVDTGFGFLPELKEVTFYIHDLQHCQIDGKRFYISPWVHSNEMTRPGFTRKYYEISKLYSKKKNAIKVQVSQYEEHVANNQETIDKLKAML